MTALVLGEDVRYHERARSDTVQVMKAVGPQNTPLPQSQGKIGDARSKVPFHKFMPVD